MLDTMPRLALAEAPAAAGKAVEQLIGDTPLLRLRRVVEGLAPAVRVLAKAEWYNPGGSIKDRAAWNIIHAAEASGNLSPDKTLIDATSGNTGIGYAMIGAARGYRIKLVLPANAANWLAHYHTTGPEIWQQTAGQVTHFVAGLGTSGTMMGVGRYLQAMNPRVRLVSLQPDGPLHGLEGLKHMQTAHVPPIYDPSLVDENREVRTEDAYEMARRLAREEGLFVGVSAAAAMVAALDVARELATGTVVTVLPDGGYKYMGERFWAEE
jgi:cysteine synthase B